MYSSRPGYKTLFLSVAVLFVGPANRVFAQPEADRAYKSAAGLLNRGMTDLAADEYNRFLKRFPDHAKSTEARYGLAICLVRAGKNAEAATQLDVVLKARDFEFAPDAQLLRGQCALALNDASGATASFDKCLREHPDFEQADVATSLLGESLFRAGKRAEARKALALFAEKWPKSAARERVELFLALCDAGDLNYKQAAERLAALLKKFPDGECSDQAALVEAQCRHHMGQSDEALRLYKSVAGAKDKALEPEALLGVAQLLRASGKPVEARRTVEELLKNFPDATTGDTARLEHARAFYDEGKYKEALADLDEEPDANSKNPGAETLYWRAKCERKLGHPEKAAELLATAAQLCRDESLLPEILYERGVTLGSAGHGDEVVQAFLGIVERFPQHPRAADAELAAAGLLSQAGRFAESAAICDEFCRRRPGHPRMCEAIYLAAENQYFLRDFTKAESLYSRTVTACTGSTQAASSSLRRGLCLVQLGRAKEGETLLEQATTDDPKAADPALRRAALAALGDAAFSKSDWPRAEKYLRQFIAVAGTDDGLDAAYLKLALAVHRQGRAKEAVELYDRLLKELPRSPSSLQASFERAQVLIELNELDGAKKGLEEVLAREGAKGGQFTPHALRHLASIAAKQGRTREAAALLDQLAVLPGEGDTRADAILDRGLMLLGAADYTQAEKSFSQFLQSAPKHARAPEARANHAIAVSRLGRAEEALSELSTVARDAKSLSTDLALSIRYEMAWTQMQLKQDEAAAKSYSELLQIPDLPPRTVAFAAVDFAQLRMAEQKNDEALALLDRAAAAASKAESATQASVAPRVQYLRGACELRLGRAAAAAKTLSALIKEHPESDSRDSASLLLGEALLAAGKPQEAAAALRDLAARTKDKELQSNCTLRLGEACALSQDWAESKAAFERYLQVSGNDKLWFQARFGVGWALENAGKPTDAIVAYRDVTDRHKGPTAARAQFQIGECLFALKRYDEAVSELLKADILYSYPEWSAAALYEAGRCLREQKKSAEARDQFEQVVKRFPDSNWAKLAAELIDSTKPAPLPGRIKEANRADATPAPR